MTMPPLSPELQGPKASQEVTKQALALGASRYGQDLQALLSAGAPASLPLVPALIFLPTMCLNLCWFPMAIGA